MANFAFPPTKNGFVLLPSEVVDRYMLQAEDSALRVLLYVLRHGDGFEAGAALAELSVSPAVFERAVAFWISKGVLHANAKGEVCPAWCVPQTKAESTRPAKPEYDSAEIAAVVEKDTALSALFNSVQKRFSKPLSPAAMKTLYGLYDYYGFPTEVIFQLVSYCTSSGHESMKYIEQVGAEWYASGITTEERAAQYIAEKERRRSAEYTAKRVLGIGDRGFTRKEKTLLAKWFESYGFSEDMLAAAFERCVAATGRLSFTYIDKIMEKWANAGIKTHDAADFSQWSYNNLYSDKER